MSGLFKLQNLRNGDIIHSHTNGFFGNLIRKVLGSYGSHDAMVVHKDGSFAVAEALASSGGTITPLESYEIAMRSGSMTICVLRVPVADDHSQNQASLWMRENIIGTPYDFMALPRLLIKSWFGDWFKRAAGWEWAWYCTEAVASAWKSAGFDPWKKASPTPRTTEKRVQEGKLLDVSTECLSEAGRYYILKVKK